jgi:hypothetical protein
VKSQDHHPQSVPEQAEEITKAKTEKKQTQTLIRKTKKQENQNGNHVGEEGCQGKMAVMRGNSRDR